MIDARILIIDDETPIRRFLRVALEAEGYGVIEAGTARDGLAKTAREPLRWSCWILDCPMPMALQCCAICGAGARFPS